MDRAKALEQANLKYEAEGYRLAQQDARNDGDRLVETARDRCAGLLLASRQAGRTDLSGALEWLSEQLRSRQVAATLLLLLPLVEKEIQR